MIDVANEHNLVPINKRTKSEQRAIQSKGGKARAAKQRAKKTMREQMEQLLALPVMDKRTLNKLKRMGLEDDDVNNKMMVTVGLFTAASCGDVAAVKELLKLIGEDQQGGGDVEDLTPLARMLNADTDSDD